MRFAAILFAAVLGAQSAKAAGNDDNVEWNGCYIRILDGSDRTLGSTCLNFGQSGGVSMGTVPYGVGDSGYVAANYYPVSLEDVHSANRCGYQNNRAKLPPSTRPRYVNPWYWHSDPAICKDGKLVVRGEIYGFGNVRVSRFQPRT